MLKTLQLHIIIIIFPSRNFPFTVHLTGGQSGSWYKVCWWQLKTWPHWPEAVYISPAGNDSLQIQIRSTVVLVTPVNTFRPGCRLLSESVYILNCYVLYGNLVQCEVKRMSRNLRWEEMKDVGITVGQPHWNMRRKILLFHLDHPRPTAISGVL